MHAVYRIIPIYICKNKTLSLPSTQLSFCCYTPFIHSAFASLSLLPFPCSPSDHYLFLHKACSQGRLNRNHQHSRVKTTSFQQGPAPSSACPQGSKHIHEVLLLGFALTSPGTTKQVCPVLNGETGQKQVYSFFFFFSKLKTWEEVINFHRK